MGQPLPVGVGHVAEDVIDVLCGVNAFADDALSAAGVEAEFVASFVGDVVGNATEYVAGCAVACEERRSFFDVASNVVAAVEVMDVA